jgi:hypothetical protein
VFAQSLPPARQVPHILDTLIEGIIPGSSDEGVEIKYYPSLIQQGTPRPRIPRVASMMAALSRPSKRLIAALKRGNELKALGILNDEVRAGIIETLVLGDALRTAAKFGQDQVILLLLVWECVL